MAVAATVIEAPFPSISSVSEAGSRVFERIEKSLREVEGVVEGIEGVVEGVVGGVEAGLKGVTGAVEEVAEGVVEGAEEIMRIGACFDWISPTLGVWRVLSKRDRRLVFSGIEDSEEARVVLRRAGIKSTGRHYDPFSEQTMLTVKRENFSPACEVLDNFFGFS